jgi:hypothetical protein
MADAAAVRAAFAQQAGYCTELGSHFTALLCTLLGERLDRDSAVGRRVLEWPGNAAAFGDAVALRLCGGLHFLVRDGSAPALAALYPPAPLPDVETFWAALRPALEDPALLPWLDSVPQTNEVGRAAVLMAGLLVVADRFNLPLRLYELGASAGLNLQLDRYGYDLGGLKTGDATSPLQLAPEWKGPPPPAAEVRIVGRSAVDLNPVPLPAGGERLVAYVWPDQPQRLRQLQAALDLADVAPPRLDRGDAADWLEAGLTGAPEPGVARVVMHSVAFHYFPEAVQRRIAAHIAAVGARASAEATLAWLRFEEQPGEGRFSLRLRTWPGEEELLAWTHPHGRAVSWLGGPT